MLVDLLDLRDRDNRAKFMPLVNAMINSPTLGVNRKMFDDFENRNVT